MGILDAPELDAPEPNAPELDAPELDAPEPNDLTLYILPILLAVIMRYAKNDKTNAISIYA